MMQGPEKDPFITILVLLWGLIKPWAFLFFRFCVEFWNATDKYEFISVNFRMVMDYLTEQLVNLIGFLGEVFKDLLYFLTKYEFREADFRMVMDYLLEQFVILIGFLLNYLNSLLYLLFSGCIFILQVWDYIVFQVNLVITTYQEHSWYFFLGWLVNVFVLKYFVQFIILTIWFILVYYVCKLVVWLFYGDDD